ncbi:HAD family hydrolase [Parabacteroides sp. 52]|uniref:HAD family hydrolase n=1 Tax=unclassified Parabacteroides TaxID=2649774 RepID=UPI0013D51933|nr:MULTISPECIES: HAD family hydrolase [unclassified Parabacteroides]MDH6535748.1 phosphoglycolate phosphatase [Parabacteroides sp. PM5-20]NDV56365.1 HAD family hydrolase [Parabacteroides sp. 52]
MIKLVIFDLDGTLLNTIADLAASTNHALEQYKFPTHPTEAYRFFVGNGINKLFERALPEGEKTDINIQRIRTSFLPYYNTHNMDRSTPYPGITDVLQELQQQGLLLAVASNKYHEATCKLVAHYFPEIRFAKVLGQREGIAPKPDPVIVQEILSVTAVTQEETLYVGDSGVDMQTAINSGVVSCGVSWGFRPLHELENFQPDYIIHKAEEIVRIVSSHA